MDVLANTFASAGHLHTFHETKRLNKAAELDNGSMADFITIDDLLDFSNDDIGGPIGEFCNTAGSSTNSQITSAKSSSPFNSQSTSVFELDGPGDLCVPCDDLAELEWLSNFVEESFSSGDVDTNLFAIHPPGFDDQNKHRLSKQRFQNPSPVSVLESSACSTAKLGSLSSEVSAVPGRARSKRCRTGVCFWNTRILSTDASASFLESCSTSTVTVSAPLLHEPEAFAYERAEGANSMPVKKLCTANNQHHQSKPKKAHADHGAASHARRCLHCATQKTPQWRAGPLGPKTLCNACGVRYKSGRLLPEYRPAASPTFVETVHSNSHRRVLEMRKQRTSQPLSSIHEGVARGQESQRIGDRDVQSNYGDGREDQAEAGAGAGKA